MIRQPLLACMHTHNKHSIDKDPPVHQEVNAKLKGNISQTVSFPSVQKKRKYAEMGISICRTCGPKKPKQNQKQTKKKTGIR